MDEKATTKPGWKKELTMRQAITLMVIGALMFVLAIVIPTKEHSTAYYIKIVVGFLGLCVVCVGAYLRPMKAPENPK